MLILAFMTLNNRLFVAIQRNRCFKENLYSHGLVYESVASSFFSLAFMVKKQSSIKYLQYLIHTWANGKF